jgi:hypothetical protein
MGFLINIDPMTDVPSTLLAVHRSRGFEAPLPLNLSDRDTGGGMRWIRRARGERCGRRLHATKLTL